MPIYYNPNDGIYSCSCFSCRKKNYADEKEKLKKCNHCGYKQEVKNSHVFQLNNTKSEWAKNYECE